MKDITLSYLDRKPVLAPGELEEKINSAAPVLSGLVAGEEQWQGRSRLPVGGQHHLRLRDGPHSGGAGRL